MYSSESQSSDSSYVTIFMFLPSLININGLTHRDSATKYSRMECRHYHLRKLEIWYSTATYHSFDAVAFAHDEGTVLHQSKNAITV